VARMVATRIEVVLFVVTAENSLAAARLAGRDGIVRLAAA
jgi:hypothetical protein